MKRWISRGLISVLFAVGCEKAVRDEVVNPLPRAPAGSTGGDGAGAGASGNLPRADGGGDAQQPPGETSDAGESIIPPQAFTKRALLAAAAACAIGRYQDFRVHAVALRDATKSRLSGFSPENTSAVILAFRAAYASWQQAEVFRFGPAARMMDDPGGMDLRDRIYAFPQGNPCMVDQRIVDKKYASQFDAILIGGRGLSALEYLLFYEGAANACAPAIGINQTGSWAALSEAELTQRRAGYAAAAAQDVVTQLDALLEAWEGGSKVSPLLVGVTDRTPYDGEQGALNAVSHGLFYLEKEVKDYKLGLPLGLVEGCVTATCPDALESRYARLSTDSLRANLVGFRRLFQGCGKDGTGLGFDDWLREVGAGSLADDMLLALSDAQTTLDQLDPPIEEAILSDDAKVRQVHAAVKKLNDRLKTDFVSTLNLDLPMGAVGDND